MVDMQNATLAGGVSIGAVADHYLGGGGALAVGACAGVLSTCGYVYAQPWLEERAGLFDTCGVHNLHGMPGVLGGLVAALSALAAGNREAYGDEGAWAVFAKLEGGRSPAEQAAIQIAALTTTLAVAVSSGLAAGKLCAPETGLLDGPPSELFNDVASFEVPADGPVPTSDDLDVSVGEPVDGDWQANMSGKGGPVKRGKAPGAQGDYLA